MPKPSTLEICRKYLYEDEDKIPENYRERVKRVRVGFAYWYDFPTKSRKAVRDHIINNFSVAPKTAYEDIHFIEILLGNIKSAEKAWVRFRVTAMLEEAYEEAKKSKKASSRAMAMAAVADKLGKYNMLDKPDAEPLPFDEIVPQPFEPTDDPTPLGLKKDPSIRTKIRKMYEKYADDIEITDVPYEELVSDAENSEPEK